MLDPHEVDPAQLVVPAPAPTGPRRPTRPESRWLTRKARRAARKAAKADRNAHRPKRRVRWTARFILTLLILATPVLFVFSASVTAWNWWNALPSEIATTQTLPQHSTILAADGTEIATFFAENRVPVSFSQIPDYVKHAAIATEDAEFYTHPGVPIKGLVRAVYNNFTGGPRQGGSGITQQYVKNLLLTYAKTDSEREIAAGGTISRKIREAKYAFALEERMTKDEILTGYLNVSNFSNGAYGIGAAAQRYFSKTPAQLTLAESALLVGVIQSPGRLDPIENPEAALERRAHVLNRMLAEGYITAAQKATADKEPITLKQSTPANGCIASDYPLYCAWVRETLQKDPAFGETEEARADLLYRGGLTITTAMDPAAQKAALEEARTALDPTSNVAVALAVVQPGTGHVVALATNRGYGQKKGETELLLPVLNAYQPASTFKVITAATALERGWDPTTYFYAGSTYRPKNDRNYPNEGFRNSGDSTGGTLDMAGALRQSVNTWFVELEDRIGVRVVAETGVRMGMTSLPLDGDRAITEKDAALTLGSYESSPLQVASVYATIAAHGRACTPVGITKIVGPDGKDLPAPDPACHQAIRPSTADTLAQMLTGVITTGTGTRARLDDNRPAGGKTGTSNDSGAVWFAGMTPQYATAVWMGDPRGAARYPMDSVYAYGQTWNPVYGGGVPATLWKNVMNRIHEGLPIKEFAPAGGASTLGMPIVIPEVRGMTAESAARILTDAGFRVDISDKGTAVPGIAAGRVTGTIPAAGLIKTTTPTAVTLLVQPSGKTTAKK